MKMVNVVFILCFYLCRLAEAGLYITVSGANFKRAKIAVGQLHLLPGSTVGNAPLAHKVSEQIAMDLEFANLFDFIPSNLFSALDLPADLYSVPYEKFTPLGASFVLKLAYKVEGAKLILEALLFDVPGQKKIFGTRYQYPQEHYPRLVHALTEDILKELTGEKGLFFSRVLMSCKDKGRRRPAQEIYVVDTDGRNLTQLTFDKTLSLSPAWAPNAKRIAYTQFQWKVVKRIRQKGITLMLHDLTNGARKTLSALPGDNSGAAWAPDGSKIAATLSFSEHPKLYLLDPDSPSSAPQPLSERFLFKKILGDGYDKGASETMFEVEASWSPDGKKMVFSSKRTGHPNIYTVDLKSMIATQITFAGTYNASPAWSPKGDRLLFAAQRAREGHFDIYAIDPDGNNLQRITNGDALGYRVNSENPSWAPTGRHFVYAGTEQGGSYAIYATTLDGKVKRRISPQGKECTTPSWGPYEGP